jgi:hypothetical protein
VFLDRIMRKLTVRVSNPISRDQEEQVVVWAHRSPQDMLLSKGQPGSEVLAHVDVGGIRLVVDFIVIPYRSVNLQTITTHNGCLASQGAIPTDQSLPALAIV